MKIIGNKIWILITVLVLLFIFSCKKKNPVNDTADDQEAYYLDSKILAELVDKIKSGGYGEVHSLLIHFNGILVMEEYFREYDRDDLHPIYSVTKSITSAAIGIARQQGKINELDKKILDFFPEYNDIANLDSAKKAITIENLLTMTAGFLWDEVSTSFVDPRNDVVKMAGSSDWIKYVLDKPMSDYPGKRFAYNCGATMLLSSIIQKNTGQNLAAFAADHLFKPLGIVNYSWGTAKPGQITNAAYGLEMRPMDMLNFGRLYLNKGRWNNNQIIPEEWVNASTKRSVENINSASLFNATQQCDYAYQWWCYSENHVAASLLKSNDVFFAFGHADQAIWVIPHLKMVVVTTGGNHSTYQSYSLLWSYILKAVKEK